MSAPLLIRNARIIHPSAGSDAVGDLLIKDGVIARLGPTNGGAPAGTPLLAGPGMVPAPCPTAPHPHLRAPGGAARASLATATGAVAASGNTNRKWTPLMAWS